MKLIKTGIKEVYREYLNKIYLKKNLDIGIPFDSSMNIMKLKKIEKNYDKSKRKKI